MALTDLFKSRGTNLHLLNVVLLQSIGKTLLGNAMYALAGLWLVDNTYIIFYYNNIVSIEKVGVLIEEPFWICH
jgi:hypothetical protein